MKSKNTPFRRLMTVFTISASLLCVTPVMADDGTWYFVAQNDQGTIRLPMSTVASLVSTDNNHGVTVLDKNGNILVQDVIRGEFQLLDFSLISSIKQQTVEGKANLLSGMVAGKLTITGATSDITIYSADGTAVIHQTPESGTTTINVQHLTHGTYIVKTGMQTFKFVKK